MLSFATGVRVFVAVEPADMRGSFDALAGAARRLGLEPRDGHFYLFFNRAHRLCKMVWFDGSGWCLYCKRLVRGSFELPPVKDGDTQVVIDAATLTALLQGIELAARRPRWYRREAI
ncbi:MAG: IS66 family insertion sequence element accessory protein TnpB [Candidatus Rokubacteria bacterium]|nr:IS66 family insertion sequence element accessory protein TnpB [Candidatus Rokubacteria bacterium]